MHYRVIFWDGDNATLAKEIGKNNDDAIDTKQLTRFINRLIKLKKHFMFKPYFDSENNTKYVIYVGNRKLTQH